VCCYVAQCCVHSMCCSFPSNHSSCETLCEKLVSINTFSPGGI
jgi:hypothetical protein